MSPSPCFLEAADNSTYTSHVTDREPEGDPVQITEQSAGLRCDVDANDDCAAIPAMLLLDSQRRRLDCPPSSCFASCGPAHASCTHSCVGSLYNCLCPRVLSRTGAQGSTVVIACVHPVILLFQSCQNKKVKTNPYEIFVSRTNSIGRSSPSTRVESKSK